MLFFPFTGEKELFFQQINERAICLPIEEKMKVKKGAILFNFFPQLFPQQILNISDVSTWMSQEVKEEEDSFVTKSILCMPIANGQKTVIGVAQLINKVSEGAKKIIEF